MLWHHCKKRNRSRKRELFRLRLSRGKKCGILLAPQSVYHAFVRLSFFLAMKQRDLACYANVCGPFSVYDRLKQNDCAICKECGNHERT